MDGSFVAGDVLQELLAAIKAANPIKLTDDAQRAYMLAVGPSGEVNLERFAHILAMHGHHVWLRTGRLDCCCGQVALRHTFVLAGMTDPAPGLVPQLFVVDPCFKEQFQLPNATPEYLALWEALPQLFVGTAEQLMPLVELMCTQMQRVFADSATSCPPWRTPACMLTKWLPSAADDVPVAAAGASDSDSSSRPSSSNTNSALSSPAAMCQPANTAVLPPIRTAAQQALRAPDCPEGLTPRSARSPLYFEHAITTGKPMFTGPCSYEDVCEERDVGFGYAHGQRSLLVHWGQQDDGAVDLDTTRGINTGCYMASGSWGISAFGSTVSSPGCDAPGGLLRGCFSEDGSGRVADGTRARAVAIANGGRARVKADQDYRVGSGFAAGLIGRAGLEQAVGDAAVSHAHGSGGYRAPGEGAKAAGGYFGAHRTRGRAGNPTLDISRFDRNSLEDVTPVPLAWGLAAERLSSNSSMSSARKLSTTSSAKSTASTGAVCPLPARRQGSSSSQCSALSAAIAGKGVGIR